MKHLLTTIAYLVVSLAKLTDPLNLFMKENVIIHIVNMNNWASLLYDDPLIQ